MSSLRQLLAKHSSALILDAASSRVQVGWLSTNGEASWRSSDEEAGIGIFRCVADLAVQPGDVGVFLYCHGPGSILGIRTAAMALRTWCVLKPRPIFAYASLALVAHANRRADLTIIADARRERWHAFRLGHAIERVAPADLHGDLVTPEHFRHWSPLPEGTQIAPYALDAMLPQLGDADLFQPSEAPDAFLHEDPNYVTWTPQIHRAPAPS